MFYDDDRDLGEFGNDIGQDVSEHDDEFDPDSDDLLDDEPQDDTDGDADSQWLASAGRGLDEDYLIGGDSDLWGEC